MRSNETCRSLGEGDVLMDISVGQRLLRDIMMRYDHKNLDMLDACLNAGHDMRR